MGSKEDLLLSGTLFRSLDPHDLRRVAEVAVSQTFERGDVIFPEGGRPYYLHVIASGRAKVVKATPGGKEVILEIFGPGDPIGAVVAYEGRPYPATALALERTTCVQIPCDAFFALLERHPTLVRGFLIGMTQRLVELMRRIPEMAGGRVESRLASLFLRLAERMGKPSNGTVFIPFSLTRLEISEMTGTTIETTIRIMSRWKKDRLLTTEADGFSLLDHDALEKLARL